MANKKKSEKASPEEIYERNFGGKTTAKKVKEDDNIDDDSVDSTDDSFDGVKKDNPVKESDNEPKAFDKDVKKQSNETFDDGTGDIFNAPPVERDYTKSTSIGEQIESTPEPGFLRPPMDDQNEFSGQPTLDPLAQGGGTTTTGMGGKTSKAQAPPSDFRNPGMDDLATKDKRKGAAAMADTILNAYVLINQKAGELVKFDENKAVKKAVAGKFDMAVLGVVIDMPDGRSISVKQWLDELGNGVDQTFSVSEDFIAEARPLLIEILMKRGLGMTAEQRLLVVFAYDAYPKVMAVFQIKSTMNYILETCQQALSEHKKTYGSAAPPLRMQHYAQTQPKAEESKPEKPKTETQQTNSTKEPSVPEELEKQPDFISDVNMSKRKKKGDSTKPKAEEAVVVEEEEIIRDNAEIEEQPND